jgi:signal transduction histidine kinase
MSASARKAPAVCAILPVQVARRRVYVTYFAAHHCRSGHARTMRTLLRSGFNRRYVLVPMLAAVALVASVFYVAEARRVYTRELSQVIRDREDRMRKITELIYASLESESAQRGHLLTGEPAYLVPYAAGRRHAEQLLADLLSRYQARDQPEVAVLLAVRTMLEAKFIEMDRTIRLLDVGANRTSLRLVKTDVGMQVLQQIRTSLEVLRTREGERITAGVAEWEAEIRLSSLISRLSTAFTLALLLVIGLLATREIRRRDLATRDLENEVSLRTAELLDLSEHMLRITEVEKAALARELHDELGGLLVSMRMDLSQLRRRLQLPDAAAEERWARIDAGLKAGVDLKRRVIEELRPTLLDNMGLVVALRWQAEQSCQQGNIQLTAQLPEAEPELNNEAAIAVFRTVQEALSNVLKHARASAVRLVMEVSGDHATITVEDNGIGLQDDATTRAGSHGLKQMRFRMQAIRGSCDVANGPVRGTVTTIRFPIAGNVRLPVGVWEPI